MKTREREALIDKFPFGKRIAFVAFCAERCLLEVSRFEAPTAQLRALPVVGEALSALWAAAADDPWPDAVPELRAKLEAAKRTEGVAPLHVTLRSALDVLTLGLARLEEPLAPSHVFVAALDGPAILAATLYVAEMDARRAEVAVLDAALERLRDANPPITKRTFDGIEDWPRTEIAPRHREASAKAPKPAKLTSVPEILKAIASAAPDDRGPIVKQYASKLKSHLAHLYVTELSDGVRDVLQSTFLSLGGPGRAKVGEAMAALLAKGTDDERARALDGIAFLARIDVAAPPASTLVPLARSTHRGVREHALRCMSRLSKEQVDAAVPTILAAAIIDPVDSTRQEALEALHHACTGGPYKSSQARGAFRALVGLEPHAGGAVAPALLEGLTRFVVAGTERERKVALEVVAALGAAARPIAVDVARAFAAADDESAFATALLAMSPLPDECRALIEVAAKRSAASASSANAVLEKSFGARVPLAERIAQVAKQLSSDDADERVSALLAARELPRSAGAALPILLEHGAKVVARMGDAHDGELSFTREALRALGCPPDDLPHPLSRLQAFRGSVPSGTVRVERGYALAQFSTITSDAPAGIALGSVGVWEDATGRFLFVIDGAELVTVLPGGMEALAVRTEGGRGGPRSAWFVERYALPSGERQSSLEVREYVAGWPADLDVNEKTLVATIRVGDEDRPTRFRVQLGRNGEPDAVMASRKK